MACAEGGRGCFAGIRSTIDSVNTTHAKPDQRKPRGVRSGSTDRNNEHVSGGRWIENRHIFEKQNCAGSNCIVKTSQHRLSHGAIELSAQPQTKQQNSNTHHHHHISLSLSPLIYLYIENIYIYIYARTHARTRIVTRAMGHRSYPHGSLTVTCASPSN